MNMAETICRSHREKISCFKTNFPYKFESPGDVDIECSFIFPPGYSIYVEELKFLEDDPGPDNFVLVDDKPLLYYSKLDWKSRRQFFWEDLKEGHPLREESIINRRANSQCVKTLKVKTFGLTYHINEN